MQKDKNIPAHPEAGTMLSKKTTEDIKKQQPNPNDKKKPPPFADMPPRSIGPNQNDDRKKNHRVD